MKKYPLGIQDFDKLRAKNQLYVDKTELIFGLMKNNYYFLSRPRRFGKSLLVSTLKAIFEGRQELFEGLWIHDKITWRSHPVLTFSFAQSEFHTVGFVPYLHKALEVQASLHEIELTQISVGGKLEELIKKLYAKHKEGVVLLIDEYDKPLTEYIRPELTEIADKNREILREFYSPLKDLDGRMRFILLTGVSKFSKVSIFSDLNHLTDITLDPKYATLLGYTQVELEHYFAPRMAEIAESMSLTYEALLEKVRIWYNGYSWDSKQKVYNPASVLRFLDSGVFGNYWFETGTPTFLMHLLRQKFLFDVENIRVSKSLLSNGLLENIDFATLLFQTGYLTIQKIDEADICTLTYPNTEVRNAMLENLLMQYAHQNHVKPIVLDMYEALQKLDFPYFIDCLNSLLGEIPYQLFEEKQEKYYHAIIFLAFRLLGYYAQAEVSVGKGRIDLVVETQNNIFIFEFKVNGTVRQTLLQINKNQYFQRYISNPKPIYLFAIALQNKEVKSYQAKPYKK